MTPYAWSVFQSTVQIVGSVVTSVAVVVLGRCCTAACKRAQEYSRRSQRDLHAALEWESFALNCIGQIEDQSTREHLEKAHRSMSDMIAVMDAGPH